MLMAFFGTLNAQSNDNYRDGYVVLLNGDSLNGYVMDRDESAFGGLLKKVRLKPEKGWKKKYNPSQLRYYKRGENLFKSIWLSTESQLLRQRYFSRQGEGEQVFVQVMHNGAIKLYHWEYTDEDNSDIEFIPLLKKENSEEMVRATQGILGLKRKRLAEYFMDCPPLSTAILGKNISSVSEIIEIYEDSCYEN